MSEHKKEGSKAAPLSSTIKRHRVSAKGGLNEATSYGKDWLVRSCGMAENSSGQGPFPSIEYRWHIHQALLLNLVAQPFIPVL